MSEVKTLLLAQKNIKLDSQTEIERESRAYYLGKYSDEDVSYELSKNPEKMNAFLKTYQLNDGVSKEPETVYLYLFDEKTPQKYQMNQDIETNAWFPIGRDKDTMPFDEYFERHAEKVDTKKM